MDAREDDYAFDYVFGLLRTLELMPQLSRQDMHHLYFVPFVLGTLGIGNRPRVRSESTYDRRKTLFVTHQKSANCKKPQVALRHYFPVANW